MIPWKQLKNYFFVGIMPDNVTDFKSPQRNFRVIHPNSQFVFRGKSRSCRPRALELNTHNAPRLGMFFVYSYFEKDCRKKTARDNAEN